MLVAIHFFAQLRLGLAVHFFALFGRLITIYFLGAVRVVVYLAQFRLLRTIDLLGTVFLVLN